MLGSDHCATFVVAIIINNLYVQVFTCMYVYTPCKCLVPTEVRECVRSSRTGFSDSCEPSQKPRSSARIVSAFKHRVQPLTPHPKPSTATPPHHTSLLSEIIFAPVGIHVEHQGEGEWVLVNESTESSPCWAGDPGHTVRTPESCLEKAMERCPFDISPSLVKIKKDSISITRNLNNNYHYYKMNTCYLLPKLRKWALLVLKFIMPSPPSVPLSTLTFGG